LKIMGLVKLPWMDEGEIRELIEEQNLCRIAFKGEEYPYMAPFRYITLDGSMYFHFTNYGKKMRLLGRDKRVCVEVESYEPDLRKYRFVVFRGSLKAVEDAEERARVIERMAEEGRRGISDNFLAAHGFDPGEGWSTFTPDKPITVIRLENISEVVGLKNPKG
jgi:nitroimidazol reductase NimA-like FMN-containing flavoprotein (pyridoxamine 5'-phosphate oxidase superfamily)